MNYLVILLGLLRYIILIFFRNPRGELFRYVVGDLVNYLDIWRTSHAVVCRHLVGRFKVKYLNALLVDSRWIFLISRWTSRCESSRYFFRSLTPKILYNCRTSPCGLSEKYVGRNHVGYCQEFFRASHGELSRYFVGFPKENFLKILSDVWIFFIFCPSPYGDLYSCTVSIKYAKLYLTVDYCLIFVRDPNTNNNNNNYYCYYYYLRVVLFVVSFSSPFRPYFSVFSICAPILWVLPSFTYPPNLHFMSVSLWSSKAISAQACYRPRGFQEVEVRRFRDNRHFNLLEPEFYI